MPKSVEDTPSPSKAASRSHSLILSGGKVNGELQPSVAADGAQLDVDFRVCKRFGGSSDEVSRLEKLGVLCPLPVL